MSECELLFDSDDIFCFLKIQRGFQRTAEPPLLVVTGKQHQTGSDLLNIQDISIAQHDKVKVLQVEFY